MRPGPSPFYLFRARHRPGDGHNPFQRRTNATWHPNPHNLTIWQRLKPAIPTVTAWTIITTLAIQILNVKYQLKEEVEVFRSQVRVLEGMMSRVKAGEDLTDLEIRRELELCGLRERKLTSSTGRAGASGSESGWDQGAKRGEADVDGWSFGGGQEAREYRRVSWKEALMGRKTAPGEWKTAEEGDQEVVDMLKAAIEPTAVSPTPDSVPSPSPTPNPTPVQTDEDRPTPPRPVMPPKRIKVFV